MDGECTNCGEVGNWCRCSEADMPKVLDFYIHNGTDPFGRTLNDLINLTDHQLEGSHDVIQWMFPLHEASNFNEDAPLIDAASRAILSKSEVAQENMFAACLRFAAFLGFKFGIAPKTESNGPYDGWFVPAENYTERCKNWRTKHNHNNLRITRVIRSLRLFDMEFLAWAFHKAVLSAAVDAGSASDTTRRYWFAALSEDVMKSLRF